MTDQHAISPAQPLRGLRILDIGTMIAGPVAATLMADFGAEVIKIEMPGRGDPMRSIGPFVEGESLYWNVEARNKTSITLDLRREEGQQIFRDLVRTADAVVENFRPGILDKWNIGFAELSKLNERLVMLSASGFGQDGPYASRAGYDRVALAFAGLLHITGYPDRPPVRPGVAIGDYQTAVLGAFALMMSLYEAKLTGKGRQVDISLYETVFRFTEVLAPEYDQFGFVRERRGNDYFAAAPGSTFETREGRHIILTISSQPLWRRLCEAMERPDLVDHPDFATHDDRWKNIGVINDIVAQWIKSEPIDAITRKLDYGGLAYAHVLNIADQFEDPHYKARNSIATVDHPVIGPLRMPGVVPRLSDGPAAPIRPAPALGVGNDAIFRGVLGLTEEQIATLQSSGVI